MGPCTRRSRSGRTAVASARCNWPGRAVAPLLPGCAANGSLIIKARCDVSWATTAYPAYDQLTAVMAPPECRAGQARCAADGFWREQVTAMRAMAYLNGTTACWPAGPGAWPHPASTRRRTHRTGGRGPLRPPLWRYRKGPGVICLPRAQTGNDHHERTLTRDTRPIRLHGAVSPWQRGADRGTAPVTMGEFS